MPTHTLKNFGAASRLFPAAAVNNKRRISCSQASVFPGFRNQLAFMKSMGLRPSVREATLAEAAARHGIEPGLVVHADRGSAMKSDMPCADPGIARQRPELQPASRLQRHRLNARYGRLPGRRRGRGLLDRRHRRHSTRVGCKPAPPEPRRPSWRGCRRRSCRRQTLPEPWLCRRADVIVRAGSV